MSARIPMLLTLLAMASIHAAEPADAKAEKFDPETYGINRYQQIWKRSPFIKETEVTTVNQGLATKFGLVGVVMLNDVPAVFLLDKSEGNPSKSRFMVTKGKPDVTRDIQLISVSRDADPRKSTAIIKQGNEQASLPFETSGLPPTGPSSVPNTSAGLPPGIVPHQPGAIPPPPMRAIRPNPAANILPPTNQMPSQVNPAGQPAPTPIRRIIRPKPINVD